jgi:citrate lyase subunit beta/citryl-CoA lyase
MQRNRIRRSELSTPASSPKMIGQAAASEADFAFLDLEDAVAPDQKVQARQNVIAGLNTHDWGRTTRGYRINAVETPWCHDDLIEVITGAGANVDIVIVPKIRTAREVWFVDDLLTQLEHKLGLEVGRIGLEVLIEEVEALASVNEIAKSSPRLEAMILGMGDLAGSQGMQLGHIGVTDSGANDVWYYARSQMIIAARVAGIDAIDGVYADFRNPDGFRQAAAEFATLGGVGKWCIHPSQVALANEAYAPSEAAIAEAAVVVAAMDQAIADGKGAANHNGMMIDAASVRAFQVTLDRARMCGLNVD